METELIVIGVIVFLLVLITLLPIVLGLGNPRKEKRKPKRVGKSQLCLRPACLLCAFSSDPSNLHAFKQDLWRSFLAVAKGLVDEEKINTITTRIAPAIKRLVTSSVPPAHSPSFLTLDGLPSPYTRVIRRTESVWSENDALAWINDLLLITSRSAKEAHQVWSERRETQQGAGEERVKGRWRKQKEGDRTEWRWDLWNQGTLIDAHAQRAPETVLAIQQHAGHNLMSGCFFGFVYFHVVERHGPATVGSDPSEGLRQRSTKNEEGRNEKRSKENEQTMQEDETVGGERRPLRTNARLRCRFILPTPEGNACSVVLRTGSYEEKWQVGTCLVSDGSQPQELRMESQPSSEEGQKKLGDNNVIALSLVVDVWHPELAPIERQVLSALFPASADVHASSLVD